MSAASARLRAAVDQQRAAFGDLWATLSKEQRDRIVLSSRRVLVTYPARDADVVKTAARIFIADVVCSLAEAAELEATVEERSDEEPTDESGGGRRRE